MNAYRHIILMLVLSATLPAGCEREEHNSSATAPPAAVQRAEKTDWTSEEIARDTQGYLVWSDQRIQKQIAERNKRQEAISTRQAELASRQKELRSNLDNVANVRKRLEQAYQRAEDEDRWPVQMGGRKFEREKVRQILDETEQYLADRQPLAAEYDKAIARMTETGARLRKDVENLKRLRERLALDLERIRLRQGMEEVEQLRKTEAELAAMSKMLSSSDEVVDLSSLEETPKAQTIDVETLLK